MSSFNAAERTLAVKYLEQMKSNPSVDFAMFSALDMAIRALRAADCREVTVA